MSKDVTHTVCVYKAATFEQSWSGSESRLHQGAGNHCHHVEELCVLEGEKEEEQWAYDK